MVESPSVATAITRPERAVTPGYWKVSSRDAISMRGQTRSRVVNTTTGRVSSISAFGPCSSRRAG